MNDFLIATSTPPFRSSARGPFPSWAELGGPVVPAAVVTGARKRMIGSPPSVNVSTSVGVSREPGQS